MKKLKVVAKKVNNPDCNYFTAGKVYEATLVNYHYFNVIDDAGGGLLCALKDCLHIDGNWTIIGNPAVVSN